MYFNNVLANKKKAPRKVSLEQHACMLDAFSMQCSVKSSSEWFQGRKRIVAPLALLTMCNLFLKFSPWPLLCKCRLISVVFNPTESTCIVLYVFMISNELCTCCLYQQNVRNVTLFKKSSFQATQLLY